MTVKTGTYKLRRLFGFPLGRWIVASELAYVDILCVKVDGAQYDIIRSSTPSTREVLYTQSQGRLDFGVDISLQAKIFVIYQS